MDSKKINITYESSLPDRLSNLPRNIIDFILDRIPIRDAVATSILSKGWRHTWRKMPNLVFDDSFNRYVLSRDRKTLKEPATMKYNTIIGKVLLLHLGPIEKFVLHIPNVLNGSRLDLSSWMVVICQNVLKELTIVARNHRYPIWLPSYVYNCIELQHLKIQGVSRVKPPQDFGGFFNLRSLDLFELLDGTEVSALVSKCPVLEKLSLHNLVDGHTLVIDAPRLISLSVGVSMDTFLKLNDVHSVTTVSLRLGTSVKLSDLFDIFGLVPNVVNVIVALCSIRTIIVMPLDVPRSLPFTLNNHQSLTLLEDRHVHVDCNSLLV